MRVVELVAKRIPRRFGLDPIKDITGPLPDEPRRCRSVLAQHRAAGRTEPCRGEKVHRFGGRQNLLFLCCQSQLKNQIERNLVVSPTVLQIIRHLKVTGSVDATTPRRHLCAKVSLRGSTKRSGYIIRVTLQCKLVLMSYG